MIDKHERIKQLEANIAKWEAIADRHADPDRASGIRRGIRADLGEIEYLTDTAEPEPSIEDRAADLAAQRKEALQVEQIANKILIADPEVDTTEPENALAAANRADTKSVTSGRG